MENILLKRDKEDEISKLCYFINYLLNNSNSKSCSKNPVEIILHTLKSLCIASAMTYVSFEEKKK